MAKKSIKKNAGKKTTEKKSEAATGCTSANFHEAGRSEYLAHYVFSSFGTAVPVPRQEDTGLDLLCTLGERVGQRLWPVASYSVQVKSTRGPWVFADPRSIRWLVENPSPVFLCTVDKKQAKLSIYHTSPRFSVWERGVELDRLELVPGEPGRGGAHNWADDKLGGSKSWNASLGPPIAEIDLRDLLDAKSQTSTKEILRAWIDHDIDNIQRMRSSIRGFRSFLRYETNKANYSGGYRESIRAPRNEEEAEELVAAYAMQAKSISLFLHSLEAWEPFVFNAMALRRMGQANSCMDLFYGQTLLTELSKELVPDTDFDSPNSEEWFFSGLDELMDRVSELIEKPVKRTIKRLRVAKKVASAKDDGKEADVTRLVIKGHE